MTATIRRNSAHRAAGGTDPGPHRGLLRRRSARRAPRLRPAQEEGPPRHPRSDHRRRPGPHLRARPRPEVADWVGGAPWPVRLLIVVGRVRPDLRGARRCPFELVGRPWSTTSATACRTETPGCGSATRLKEAGPGDGPRRSALRPDLRAIRRFDSWWLIGGLMFFGIALVLNFVYPVLIMPRFNKFTPMPEGELRTRIEEIADWPRRRSRASTRWTARSGHDGATPSWPASARPSASWSTTRCSTCRSSRSPGRRPRDRPLPPQPHPQDVPVRRAARCSSRWPFVQYVAGSDTVLGWAGVDDLGRPGGGAGLPARLRRRRR